MAYKNLTKTKVFIEEDHEFDGAGLGKKYLVRAETYNSKTNALIEKHSWGTGYTLKDARKAVKRIKKTFAWNFVKS